MKILLVYPKTPGTFWSLENAIKFIKKKALEPPLGLLTVAALLPEEWETRLVDMNVRSLEDEAIRWADLVFLGGMSIQKSSFDRVVERCRGLGVTVVAGGPMCTMEPDAFPDVDHLVLGEAELSLPPFLRDLEEGHPNRVYTAPEFADITSTPRPRWDLLDVDAYALMDIQYSRGCPYNCDFCTITMLYGHRPRIKDTDQFLGELDALCDSGWRGAVFVVDDNFIGNRGRLKRDFLPALIEWSERRGHPFEFSTEVSIDLADDPELTALMVRAGFKMVFVGIETPDEGSLAECGKRQNQGRDMMESVKTLQRRGLVVAGGFIVGFDHDGPDIFERMIRFIQNSGICTAMVGLLNAPLGTKLFQRLSAENRILSSMSGDNMDGSLNFVPRMNPGLLLEGYRRVIRTIYSQGAYFERIKTFLAEYTVPRFPPARRTPAEIGAVLRAFWRLGVVERGRRFFWRLVFHVLHKHPEKAGTAFRMAIYGFHYRKVIERI